MDKILEELSDEEKIIVDKLSQVVDIVGDIYREQENPANLAGNLYPSDITREEFDQAAIRDPELKRFDTVVERTSASFYKAIPYNVKYQDHYAKMIPLLEEARDLADDSSFRVYLRSVITCLEEGTVESFRHMMMAWVRTKGYHINFPFTYDELYLDQLMGIKGGFNAAVFVEDEELTPKIKKPTRLLNEFKKTLIMPNGANVYPYASAAVYNTVNHQGVMASMKLRAWCVPDDKQTRLEAGTRQIMIKEGILEAFDKHVVPVMENLYPEILQEIDKDTLQLGLFWSITLHELSHTIGNYEAGKKLEKYFPAYEELKSFIMPMLWMFYCGEQSNCNEKEIKSVVYTNLALNITNAVLALKIKTRESYASAAYMQYNYLLDNGAISINDGKLDLDLEKLKDHSRECLETVMSIIGNGSYSRAKSFVDKYGHSRKFGNFVKRMADSINTNS